MQKCCHCNRCRINNNQPGTVGAHTCWIQTVGGIISCHGTFDLPAVRWGILPADWLPGMRPSTARPAHMPRMRVGSLPHCTIILRIGGLGRGVRRRWSGWTGNEQIPAGRCRDRHFHPPPCTHPPRGRPGTGVVRKGDRAEGANRQAVRNRFAGRYRQRNVVIT